MKPARRARSHERSAGTRPVKATIARARTRIAAMITALPEGRAVAAGEHLSLEVRNKRLGWFLADHHGDGRLAINCKASALIAQHLAAAVPNQFHIPKYAGHRGWIGLWLDVPDVDWPQVEATLREAYRLAAPRTLLHKLDAAS